MDAQTHERAVDLVRAKVERDGEADLQPGMQSRLHLQVGLPERGSVVLLHGFSAGPWQYDEIGPRLHAHGFNVYVPRLPGHGPRSAADLPGTHDHIRYDRFAESVYADLVALGGPVHVVGLSGGGAVATRILEAHYDIARAVLIAPFYAPRDRKARLQLRLLGRAMRLTGGAAGLAVDRIPFSMGTVDFHRPGHLEIRVGNLYGLAQVGRRAHDDAHKIRTPIQFITTSEDWAIDPDAMERVYRAAGGAARHQWHHFSPKDAVPHAMFHPDENPNPKTREQVIELIERGLGINAGVQVNSG